MKVELIKVEGVVGWFMGGENLKEMKTRLSETPFWF
jgi:hypothetical protein